MVVCSGSEAGSYLRLIDSCITQLKAQGPSETCNESKEEEEEEEECRVYPDGPTMTHPMRWLRFSFSWTTWRSVWRLGFSV